MLHSLQSHHNPISAIEAVIFICNRKYRMFMSHWYVARFKLNFDLSQHRCNCAVHRIHFSRMSKNPLGFECLGGLYMFALISHRRELSAQGLRPILFFLCHTVDMFKIYCDFLNFRLNIAREVNCLRNSGMRFLKLIVYCCFCFILRCDHCITDLNEKGSTKKSTVGSVDSSTHV